MKIIKISLYILFALLTIESASAGHVNGHYRSNGTYVNGYQRTNPDGNKFNNYSTQGNYNPYNGKVGTVDPYRD
jgi:hypothetical protein